MRIEHDSRPTPSGGSRRAGIAGAALAGAGLAAAALAACSADGGKPGGGDAGGDAGDAGAGAPDAGPDLPPAVCREGTRYQDGTSAFREATEDWGLAGIGVQGTRLSVTDLDGDGWADLIVRDGGGADHFAEDGARTTWLLRNTGGGFEDVTRASGLRARRRGGKDETGRPGEVVASGDVDNDGDLDVFTATPRGGPAGPDDETSELMINDGAGGFSLGPEDSDARAAGGATVPAGVTFVDFDRDGLLDLWVAENMPGGVDRPLQDRLYRGDGEGRFRDVTADAGLTTAWGLEALDGGRAHSWGWSSAACDLNGDGWPELLASSYGRMPNHLWQARGDGGDGGYDNRSVASGYAFDDRTDWTDNESARCYCRLHRGAADCAGVPEPRAVPCRTDADVFRWDHTLDRRPFRLGGNSGATACADVDNDGDLDLVTGEIVHWDVGSSSDPAELLVNTGVPDVRFDRPGNGATGLARPPKVSGWNEGIMTSAVFDFDNDGWPDVYLGGSDYPGERGRLYHQESPGRFRELPVADFFRHHRSHGVVAADFDRDGDLDVAVGHSHARCGTDGDPTPCYPTRAVRLFENRLGDRGNWIQLRLEGGSGSNRAAIGARVTVAAGGVTQTQEVDGGHGHFNTQRDLVLHFGLGEACEAEVTVRWPDVGLSEDRITLPAGHRFRLRQGGAVAVEDAPSP